MVVWAVPYVCTCVYARKWGRGSEGVKRDMAIRRLPLEIIDSLWWGQQREEPCER